MSITAEELGRLRVRLDKLPGFDPVGLSVWADRTTTWSACEHQELCAERHTSDAPDYEGPEYDDVVLADRDREVVEARLVYGDLADSTAADRLARWVAGRVGLEVGCTAPGWWRIGGREYQLASQLAPWASTILFAVWFYPTGFDGLKSEVRIVPALAALDPHDDRRLPDGSRYVDRLALALVAVHVGGA